MGLEPKETIRYVNVHLVRGHSVRGVNDVIDFLLKSDAHFVEGLFWMAKRNGNVEFEYQGTLFELVKNRDLTFTIQEHESEDVRYLEQFRS